MEWEKKLLAISLSQCDCMKLRLHKYLPRFTSSWIWNIPISFPPEIWQIFLWSTAFYCILLCFTFAVDYYSTFIVFIFLFAGFFSINVCQIFFFYIIIQMCRLLTNYCVLYLQERLVQRINIVSSTPIINAANSKRNITWRIT